MMEMNPIEKVTKAEVISEKNVSSIKKKVKILDDNSQRDKSQEWHSAENGENDPVVMSIIKNDNKLCNKLVSNGIKDSTTVQLNASKKMEPITAKTARKERKLSIGPKLITLPQCDISRGLLMAIIFLILIFILIIWFLFSSDNIDHANEVLHNSKRNSYLSSYMANRTVTKYASNSTETNTLLADSYADEDFGMNGEETTIFTNKVFIFSSTFLIVLSIIAMVFIVAIINYYKKPTKPLKSNASLKEVLAHTLFTHRSHHGHLYYIEQAEKKQHRQQQERLLSASEKPLDNVGAKNDKPRNFEPGKSEPQTSHKAVMR